MAAPFKWNSEISLGHVVSGVVVIASATALVVTLRGEINLVRAEIGLVRSEISLAKAQLHAETETNSASIIASDKLAAVQAKLMLAFMREIIAKAGGQSTASHREQDQ